MDKNLEQLTDDTLPGERALSFNYKPYQPTRWYNRKYGPSIGLLLAATVIGYALFSFYPPVRCALTDLNRGAVESVTSTLADVGDAINSIVK